MEFICTNKECKHTFHPHSYIAFMHPNKAKCPVCKTKAIKSEKGEAEWKDFNFMKNQSKSERNRHSKRRSRNG